MLFGTITHAAAGIGIIRAGDTTYKFSLIDFPRAVEGMRVWFNPTNINHFSRDAWVSSIHAFDDYELPEEWFIERLGEDDIA